jgi:four helix bundle protein
MSNIAEGFESSTQKTFIKYLGHAKASAGEVRAQLYIVKDQGYISEEDFEKTREMAEICSKQLSRFIQYLNNQPNSRRVRETGVTYDV